MITCPACGASNLAGADPCERCGQPIPGEADDPRSDVERHILGDALADLSPGPAPTVRPDASIAEALAVLAGASRGCVVVVEDGRAVGIFSERDAVMRIEDPSAERLSRAVSTVMTPGPRTLEVDAPVAFALQHMSGGGYRHIPVTRDGRLVGLISARDVLRYIADHGLEPETG